MVDTGTSGISREVCLNGSVLKILPCRYTKKSRFLEAALMREAEESLKFCKLIAD
jgi:hypothetical protein